mgnify:CR=1 FL=1
MSLSRRSFVSTALAGASSLALVKPAYAATTPSAVVEWNGALTAAIAATATQATVAARAISMVNEALYNAWAAYDWTAGFTLWGIFRRPWYEWNATRKAIAVSQAAYVVLLDLFPSQSGPLNALLAKYVTPAVTRDYGNYWAMQTGQAAANRLLDKRRADGANQYGDLAPGAYADYTGYAPVNTPDQLIDPNRWQPLRLTNAQGQLVVQKFLTPQWGLVRAFALSSGAALRPTMDHLTPTQAEMQQLIDFSANLTVEDKALVEAWAANPGTVSPPGQWIQIATMVSANDGNSLDQDAKMFFAVAQALLDASIAAWDAKRYWDSVRPISALRYYYAGQSLRSWGGPDQGTQTVDGSQWRPFQRASNPTPPFAEFPSGHSTFSAAASTVLAAFRGDVVTVGFTVRQGGIGFETNMPPQPVLLSWPTLSQAAAAAGTSRRVGGIHFQQGDFAGRVLGRQVGDLVVARARTLGLC